jgi:shikimate kinase
MATTVGRPTLDAIIGPPAVGKMTVGQELARLTGFPLYHNHMVIDLLTPFFEFGSESFRRLVDLYREQFFDEVVRQCLSVITTWGWDFDLPEDHEIMSRYIAPFLAADGDVWFVELAAPLATRLERNHTENRRAHKRMDWATDDVLRDLDRQHRMNTSGDFPYPDRHLLLDTAPLEPAAAAEAICERFGLARIAH